MVLFNWNYCKFCALSQYVLETHLSKLDNILDTRPTYALPRENYEGKCHILHCH